MITIELLYFDGCPSWKRAWSGIAQALAQSGVDVTVHLRDIESLPESELAGFAGSPTVRINGIDLEAYDGPPVVACRRYQDNEGRGWPSKALLLERLYYVAGRVQP